MSWQIAISRTRAALLLGGLAFLFGGGFLGVPVLVRIVVVVVVNALVVSAGTVRREPMVVRSSVAGRWRALNSPATRVPSHEVQTYGQTYAIDVVNEPPGLDRPKPGWQPLGRRPDAFPGFGQPVLGHEAVEANGWCRWRGPSRRRAH